MTRNVSNAMAPSSAAAEESPPLGELGDLIIEQPDADNDTDIDTAPSPGLRQPLPAGMPFLQHNQSHCSPISKSEQSLRSENTAAAGLCVHQLQITINLLAQHPFAHEVRLFLSQALPAGMHLLWLADLISSLLC